MKTTLQLLLFMLAWSTLLACVSQPAYRPDEGGGWGYSDSILGDNRYRVRFRMYSNGHLHDRDSAMDYAMLRAASLTIEKGYDWFIVRDRQTHQNQDNTVVTTAAPMPPITTQQCGLLGCRTSYYPAPEMAITTLPAENSEIEALLDISLGKGVRPTGDNSFDAHEVRDTLAAKAN